MDTNEVSMAAKLRWARIEHLTNEFLSKNSSYGRFSLSLQPLSMLIAISRTNPFASGPDVPDVSFSVSVPSGGFLHRTTDVDIVQKVVEGLNSALDKWHQDRSLRSENESDILPFSDAPFDPAVPSIEYKDYPLDSFEPMEMEPKSDMSNISAFPHLTRMILGEYPDELDDPVRQDGGASIDDIEPMKCTILATFESFQITSDAPDGKFNIYCTHALTAEFLLDCKDVIDVAQIVMDDLPTNNYLVYLGKLIGDRYGDNLEVEQHLAMERIVDKLNYLVETERFLQGITQ